MLVNICYRCMLVFMLLMIHRCTSSFKHIKSESVKLLHPYAALPLSTNLHFLSNIGRWLAKGSCLQPNWSGFMQHVSSELHPPSDEILMMPITYLKPMDNHCIYSTLCFVEKQANQLEINSLCITFDQPLKLKTIEIILVTNLKLVSDLGDSCYDELPGKHRHGNGWIRTS